MHQAQSGGSRGGQGLEGRLGGAWGCTGGAGEPESGGPAAAGSPILSDSKRTLKAGHKSLGFSPAVTRCHCRKKSDLKTDAWEEVLLFCIQAVTWVTMGSR